MYQWMSALEKDCWSCIAEAPFGGSHDIIQALFSGFSCYMFSYEVADGIEFYSGFT